MSNNPESDRSQAPELTDKDLAEASGGRVINMEPIVITVSKPGAGTGSETHDPGLKNQSTKL